MRITLTYSFTYLWAKKKDTNPEHVCVILHYKCHFHWFKKIFPKKQRLLDFSGSKRPLTRTESCRTIFQAWKYKYSKNMFRFSITFPDIHCKHVQTIYHCVNLPTWTASSKASVTAHFGGTKHSDSVLGLNWILFPRNFLAEMHFSFCYIQCCKFTKPVGKMILRGSRQLAWHYPESTLSQVMFH